MFGYKFKKQKRIEELEKILEHSFQSIKNVRGAMETNQTIEKESHRVLTDAANRINVFNGKFAYYTYYRDKPQLPEDRMIKEHSIPCL